MVENYPDLTYADGHRSLSRYFPENRYLLVPMPARIKFKSRADKVFYRHDREQLLRKQNGRCAYCMKPLSPREATMDHVIPLSLVGRVHSVANCVAACEDCNSRKGNSINFCPATRKHISSTVLPDSVQKAISDMCDRLEERTRLAEYRLSMDPKGGFRKWVRYWKKRGRWT